MLNIKNKIEFDKCFVEVVEINFNESQRMRFKVAHLANVTKGGFESKNPELRFNSFLTESANKPSVPLEFIPLSLPANYYNKFLPDSLIQLHNKLFRYCYITKYNEIIKYLTNLRVVLNAGVPLNEIPFNTATEVKDFKIITAKLPYFVWMHLRTHRAFSFMIETCRKSKMSEEFYETTDKNYQNKPELLRMRLGCFAGWLNDENSFQNLFEVRQSKSTQVDTFKVIENIQKLFTN